VDAAEPDQAPGDIAFAAKSTGILFAGRIFLWAMRFGIAIFLARVLGVHGYGAYNLALGVATVASLVPPLGLDAAVVRYTAIFAARRDWPAVNANLRFMIGLPGAVSLLVAGGLFILAEPISEAVLHDRHLAPLVIVSAAMVPTMVLTAQLVGALRGLKRMSHAVMAELVGQPLVRLVALLAFLALGMGVVGALLAWTVASWVTTVLLAGFLIRVFPRVQVGDVTGWRAWELLRYSGPLFISNLVIKSGFQLQTLLLGALSTVSQAGIFAVAGNVNLIGSLFHSSLVAAAMPIFAQLQDREDPRALERLYQTTSKWSFTLNLPVFLMIVVFPQGLLAMFGPDFKSGAVPLAILAAANLVNAATGMSGVVLDMTGHTGLKVVNVTIAVAAGIALNVALVPALGLIGAALALLTVTTLANILPLTEVMLMIRVSPYSAAFLKPIMAGGLALVVGLGTRLLLGGDGEVATAMIGIAVLFATYVAMLLILGIDEDDRLVWRTARRRLTRAGRGSAATPPEESP
jgi:O-antigen/teichoic acid export membrane protein